MLGGGGDTPRLQANPFYKTQKGASHPHIRFSVQTPRSIPVCPPCAQGCYANGPQSLWRSLSLSLSQVCTCGVSISTASSLFWGQITAASHTGALPVGPGVHGCSGPRAGKRSWPARLRTALRVGGWEGSRTRALHHKAGASQLPPERHASCSSLLPTRRARARPLPGSMKAPTPTDGASQRKAKKGQDSMFSI